MTYVYFTLTLTPNFIVLLFLIYVLIRSFIKNKEPEYKWTIPPELKIPEWTIPPDYQRHVYTLTFNNIDFFETKDGIYRHYRIEKAPLEYPKPAPKCVNQFTPSYDYLPVKKHPLGIHSPASYEYEEVPRIGMGRGFGVRRILRR